MIVWHPRRWDGLDLNSRIMTNMNNISTFQSISIRVLRLDMDALYETRDVLILHAVFDTLLEFYNTLTLL